ncbi:MAG: hypothetical protein NVS4B6_04230 [Mycobacterium sp.]
MVLTYLLVRKVRGRRGQPLHQCRPVAVIDRKLGLFSYGGVGNVDELLTAVVRGD